MKIKKYLFIVLAGIVVIACAAYGIGWLVSYKQTLTDIPSLAELVPNKSVAIGEGVKATISFELPLYRKVEKTLLTSGTNTVAAGDVKVASSYLWNKRKWVITALLRPYSPGDTGPGVLSLELTPTKGSKEKEVFTVAIPSFLVKNLSTVSGQLTLADAENINQPWYQKNLRYLYIAGGALLVIIILLVILFRKKSKEKIIVIPEWQQALNEVEDLRNKVENNFVNSSIGFALLNDIVRRYLERRFFLMATKLTTEEFLFKLERNDSLFSIESKAFLRDFVSFSDLVKFAKQETTIDTFNAAAKSAISLIDATKPMEVDSSGRRIDKKENEK
jgi:hypothetical protein